MTAGRFGDERWASLPLGLDFDADDDGRDFEDLEAHLQLPPGHHVVIVRGGARIAVDLPDIGEWNGECRFYAA